MRFYFRLEIFHSKAGPLKSRQAPKGNEKVFQSSIFMGELLNFGGASEHFSGKLGETIVHICFQDVRMATITI